MSEAAQSLNAPSGAGCFLTFPDFSTQVFTEESLNAPSGAGFFLTELMSLLGWLRRRS